MHPHKWIYTCTHMYTYMYLCVCTYTQEIDIDIDIDFNEICFTITTLKLGQSCYK